MVISREAGAQLDRAAVDAFLSRYSSRRSIASVSFAAALPQRILMALQTASAGLGVSASGVTSLLPALGASGLLALASTPGHQLQRRLASGHSTATANGLGEPILRQLPQGEARTGNAGTHDGSSGSQGGTPRFFASTAPSTVQRNTVTTSTTQAPTQQSPSSGGSPPPTGRTSPPPAGGTSPPVGAIAPPPSGAVGSASGAGVVTSTTETLTSAATTVLSGTTETVSGATEALTGHEPASETGGALLAGASKL